MDLFKIEYLQQVNQVLNSNKQLFGVYIQPKKQERYFIDQAIKEYCLSKREAEIVDLISKGHSNNEIAAT
ncbi:helix-turn-helix domain-containing protein [Bacillus salipaludis]|uniref:Helix-turn-helix domain-containing protein n=1 Tax=Bacillus salipaludis TaxID=2547811 RepID=A0A4R5VLP0_9BACI|nr:response regulator transcription factor [Bacillus salipaludis]TDK58203.1 helix-turn-helix domain-containing protein [Bacillus salipaludis]